MSNRLLFGRSSNAAAWRCQVWSAQCSFGFEPMLQAATAIATAAFRLLLAMQVLCSYFQAFAPNTLP